MLTPSDLIAHRGWQRRYPENTLIGVLAALNAGAQQIEVDVQLTADGVPVLFHDRDLQRVCAADGAIGEYPLAALAPLSASEPARFGSRFAGTPICTLAQLCDVFQAHAQARLYVEVKRTAVAQWGAARAVEAILPFIQPLAQRCTLISFSLEALSAAQAAGWTRLGPVLSDWEQIREPAVAALAPELVFINHEKIPEQAELHASPFAVAVYEIDTLPAAEQWLARGARFVESFAIGELLAGLQG